MQRAFAAFTAPMAARAMTLAPGRLDLAISMVSTAVNVGISFGALLGSVVVEQWGPRATALLGAGFTAAALAATAWDRPSRPRRTDHARGHSAGPGARQLVDAHA